MSIALRFALAGVALGLMVSGCGSASPSATSASRPAGGSLVPPAREVSPAGDIPDTQVYVAYAPPGAGFAVKVPEGWSRTRAGAATTFTDKLNSVRMELAPAERSATTAAVTGTVLPRLARTVPGYSAGAVTTVSRRAGTAVKVTYQATSPPDPVTGRTHREAVERYEFARAGRVAVLTLSGPVGADNVDPWKIVTDSFRWGR